MKDNKNQGIFLTFKPKDSKVNGFDDHHFSVEATVKEAVGSVEDATIDTKSNNYIIKVKTEVQAQKLLRLRKLKDGFRIKVEKHVKLNHSKAIMMLKNTRVW